MFSSQGLLVGLHRIAGRNGKHHPQDERQIGERVAARDPDEWLPQIATRSLHPVAVRLDQVLGRLAGVFLVHRGRRRSGTAARSSAPPAVDHWRTNSRFKPAKTRARTKVMVAKRLTRPRSEARQAQARTKAAAT